MAISDPYHSTAFSNISPSKPLEQDTAKQCQSVQRLALNLDFAHVSHEASNTHPHILFSPIHYEPGYAYPLLVWLHDQGGDERQVMRIMPEVSMRNYVAVAPQGIRLEPEIETPRPTNLDVSSILQAAKRSRVTYDWPDTADGVTETERRIFDCISVAKARNNIAPQRIFLAGFGTGGTMALRMAFLYPEHFAGVASLSGCLPKEGPVLHRWTAARSLPVLLGLGQTSSTFSPESGCQALELLHTAGFPMTVREYDCGRELVPAMLQDLNRWIMNLVCGQ